jgi:hypothetical protein
MYNNGVKGTRAVDKTGFVTNKDFFYQSLYPHAIITSWAVATSASDLTPLDDTSITSGETVIIYCSNVTSSMSLYIGSAIVSYSVVDSARITFVAPNLANGTYTLYLVSSSGSGAIYSPGITYSGFPTWATSSYLSPNPNTINVQLAASGDGTLTYRLQSGSSLPIGISLSSSGLISGSISTGTGVVAYTFTVIADDAQLQSSQQLVTLTVAFNDSGFNNTISQITGDPPTTSVITNATTNSTATTATITVLGDVKATAWHPFIGDGYYSYGFFSGTDYFTLSNSAYLNPGSGNFTLELWAYPTSLSANASLYRGDANGIEIYLDASNRISVGHANVSQLIFDPTTWVPNTWYHIAVIRSGTTLSLYKNGVRVATATNSTTFTASSTNYIGRNALTSYYYGYISNLRLVVGSAVYDPTATTITVPTSPLTAITNTALLTCQSNRFRNSSANNLLLTPVGTPQVSTAIPFTSPTSASVNTGYSVYFNGTTDYLQAAHNTALDLSSGDFTVECWAYVMAVSNGLYLINKSGISGIRVGAFTIQYVSASSAWAFVTSNSGTATSGQFFTFGSGSNVLNTWIHFAVTRIGTTITTYLNGVAVTAATQTSAIIDSGNPLVIGSQRDGNPYFNGYVSNFRIIKGTGIYTTGFTPSTIPLTAITGTTFLSCQGSQIVDASTNTFTITTFGLPKLIDNNYPFTQTTTTVTDLITFGSAYFDGTGDYLQFPTGSTIFTFGTDDFTVECWIYFRTLPATYNHIMGTSTGANGFGFGIGGSSKMYITTSQAGAESPNTVIYPNTWYHLAWTRQSGTVKMWLNGYLEHTVAFATNITETLGTIGAVTGGGYPTNAHISNVRVTKNIALYTATSAIIYQPLTITTGTQLLTLQNTGGINNYGIIDNGPFGHILTPSSPIPQGSVSPFSQVGNSIFFTTNGADYLIYADPTVGNTTADSTIECWVYMTQNPSTRSWICSSAGGAVYGIAITPTTYNIQIWFGTYTTNIFQTTNSIGLNAWYHIAVTHQYSTGQIIVYINGQADPTTASGYTTMGGGSALNIGRYSAANQNFWGFISNFRISFNQILYQQNFTVPVFPLTTSSYTAFLIGQSRNFTDSSINAYPTTTISGTPSIRSISPFSSGSSYSPTTNGGSVIFNALAGNFKTTTRLALGGSDSTVEFWIYPFANTAQMVWAVGIDGSSSNIGFQLLNGTWQVLRGAGTTTIPSQTKIIPALVWSHVAFMRLAATSTLYIYVNGQLSVTYATSMDNSTWTGAGAGVSIGYLGYTGASAANCYLSDFRVSTSALGSTATSTISVPTAPLTASTSTALLLNFNNAAFPDAHSNSITETVGASQVSTFSKYGSGSMFFNGTSQYITYPASSTLFNFGTLDFTVEGWAWTASSAAIQNIFSILDTASSAYAAIRVQVLTNLSLQWLLTTASGSWGVNVTAGTITSSTWFHFAVTRSSGSVYFFLNGTQVGGTQSYATALVSAGTTYIGGNSGGFYFSGYIDDFRVSRTARYTANFTVPSSALNTR